MAAAHAPPSGMPVPGRPPMGHAPPHASPQAVPHAGPPQVSPHAPPQESRKAPIGLIVGIAGGLLAVIAVVLIFVLRKGDDEKNKDEAEVAEGKAAVELGGLSLELTPADALVKVDGKEYPGASPRIITGLEPGPRTLEISKGETSMPFSQEVVVAAGETLTLPAIKLQPRDVTLTIEVDPPQTEVVLVAGTATTPIGKDAASHKHPLKREPGVSYELKGTAPGFLPATVAVDFDGQPAQKLTLSLLADPNAKVVADAKPTKKPTKKPAKKTSAKAKTGMLRIGAAPGLPPATVYINGRKQSKKTPMFIPVAPGRYTVKWKWSDGSSSTKSVTVGKDETKVLKGSK